MLQGYLGRARDGTLGVHRWGRATDGDAQQTGICHMCVMSRPEVDPGGNTPPSESDSDENDHWSRRSKHSSKSEGHRDRRRDAGQRDHRDCRGRRGDNSPSSSLSSSSSKSDSLRMTMDPLIVLMQHNTMIDKYCTLIRDRVTFGQDRYVEVWGLKINLPPPYDGVDDAEQFDEWLIALLRYLRIINLCGPEKDSQQINVCGNALKELAFSWFYTEVESMCREHLEWIFENVVCTMF